MKTNFIRQISHEIRTPLNILNGFTQVLTTQEAEIGTAEKKDIQQRISENTTRITELINKMLELSEASSQTIIERQDNATAMEVASEAIEHSGITKATHVRFDMADENGAGKIRFKTNIRYATRALALLLDNAQKFTKQGSVRLIVSQQDGLVNYAVEDTGIGIPPEESEHIFGEFVQLDEYYDGTGIGLAIARSIVRRLGGDITLDTSYSGGSRFVMTLPIKDI
jgi:signal transduction histidine kinase